MVTSMFKNNLFIKICVSFWLTTLFMIGAVLAVDWLTDSGPFRSGRPPGPGVPLAVHGRAFAWIYEHEGVSALRNFAVSLREVNDIRAHFLDENDVDLTATAEVSGTGAAVAATEAATPGRTSSDGKRRTTLKIAGAGGKTYTVVSEMPPFPPPPGMPAPWTMNMVRLLVVLTVSGLICYLLARYLTEPILKIGAAARKLATGDLTVRVSQRLGTRNDEMSRLALDFDRMAERIESLLNSQSILLRDISHELRSPLARLNVALELSRRGADRELGKSLDRIERESGRLNEMIGHILTLSRVESGIAILEKKDIDLTKLIREIADDADFEARGLNRRVKITASDTCFIEGDEDLLRRAIDNVARNAVRYTEEGSNVEISLRCSQDPDDRCVIKIRDHGIGVPAASLSQLFRPFYRVGDGRERETGGTGLALAITEAAIRLHGGTVRAANADSGGLIVEISLPFHPSHVEKAI